MLRRLAVILTCLTLLAPLRAASATARAEAPAAPVFATILRQAAEGAAAVA